MTCIHFLLQDRSSDKEISESKRRKESPDTAAPAREIEATKVRRVASQMNTRCLRRPGLQCKFPHLVHFLKEYVCVWFKAQ